MNQLKNFARDTKEDLKTRSSASTAIPSYATMAMFKRPIRIDSIPIGDMQGESALLSMLTLSESE